MVKSMCYLHLTYFKIAEVWRLGTVPVTHHNMSNKCNTIFNRVTIPHCSVFLSAVQTSKSEPDVLRLKGNWWRRATDGDLTTTTRGDTVTYRQQQLKGIHPRSGLQSLNFAPKLDRHHVQADSGPPHRGGPRGPVGRRPGPPRRHLRSSRTQVSATIQ